MIRKSRHQSSQKEKSFRVLEIKDERCRRLGAREDLVEMKMDKRGRKRVIF